MFGMVANLPGSWTMAFVGAGFAALIAGGCGG
jgi:hypothetical protein